MKRKAILLIVGILLTFPATGQEHDMTTFYVGKNGNDEWSGKLASPNDAKTDGPFATIARARDAIRQLKATGLKQPVTVMVRKGVYDLDQTLLFAQQDSGTKEYPITYQAYPGETVVLRGGHMVTGWKPWRDGIMQTDLKAQGLDGVSFHQLFYKDKRQVLARYPNFDPEHPRTGGFLYVADRGFKRGQQFTYKKGSIPFGNWGDLSQAEVFTVFGGGWNFAIAPILDVDKERYLITTRRVRRDYEPANRFFIQNVLGALDQPGEWYLDRKNGVLYFYPPNGEMTDGDVAVPLLDNLIELKGTIPYPHEYLNVRYRGSRADCPLPDDAPPLIPVERLTFKGFRMECARQNAIRLVGARHCSVVGNRITNIGNVGINLGGVASAHEEVGNPRVTPATGYSGGVGGGGQNILFNDPCQECRVIGNDVWSVGSDGIFLYGTGNVAENNHVYNSGLFDKDCACINLWGEKNVARRNTLHDVPRNAIYIKGIDNVVELNDIHHTMLETCDGGAIRMCQRNLTIRGNVIRFNKIFDTVGYGYPRSTYTFESPYFSWGVYLDDFTCGTTVYGNIIVRCGRGGVHFHGGSDNIMENNIVVDGGLYQFENNPIRQHPVSGNQVKRNIFYYTNKEAFLYRCGKWIDGSVAWKNNLVWTGSTPIQVGLGGKNIIEGWKAWMDTGLPKGSLNTDPLFENPNTGDYLPKSDSPAWKLGFKKIPVERIGCYEAPDRACWPLRIEGTLIRETPVFYSAPPRPLHEDFDMEPVGRLPRRGDLSPRGATRCFHITDETAASGKHSLKIVDRAGLPHRWEPRIFYAFAYKTGEIRFACDLRLSSQHPPQVGMDFRQYSETGDKEYFSGPHLSIDAKGELSAGRQVLMRVPLDTWFSIEVLMTLGEDAVSTYKLSIHVPGQEPQTFEAPYVRSEFNRLERVVIMSNADDYTVFYLDNVSCGPESGRD
ncbi:MAG: right-handed parallel beta-helix repeat-containing protein [Planctomycetes bacterium]|nr:right-handed parallel beta-helix repeat-containing protein [Planctomycetota bacterium]